MTDWFAESDEKVCFWIQISDQIIRVIPFSTHWPAGPAGAQKLGDRYFWRAIMKLLKICGVEFPPPPYMSTIMNTPNKSDSDHLINLIWYSERVVERHPFIHHIVAQALERSLWRLRMSKWIKINSYVHIGTIMKLLYFSLHTYRYHFSIICFFLVSKRGFVMFYRGSQRCSRFSGRWTRGKCGHRWAELDWCRDGCVAGLLDWCSKPWY